MTAATLAPPARIDWTRHKLLLTGAALLGLALLLRFAQFGNPINGLDEQYYLLVGDRMWHGAIPYIDLWDRKPFGLFALFAAIRLLPGDGILAAQVVAMLFVAGTGLLVALIARRSTEWLPAALAGAAYLAGVNTLWGETTQTPVFYNLLIAAAALLTLRAAADPFARRREALLAMLLAGLAIQIKTIAVIEGGFFGLWLVAAAWRTSRDPVRTLAFAARLALVGAGPTLAVMLGYAAIGQFPAWWYANVLSILAKGAPLDSDSLDRLRGTLLLCTPMLLLTGVGLWVASRRFKRWTGDLPFLLGWIAVALLDYLAIGGFWPHYALPLLLACTPLLAHALALPRYGRVLFATLLAWPLVQAVAITPGIAASDRAAAARVVAAIPPEVRTRCMFVYEGPVAYYTLTDACTVTPYSFTAHLRSERESASLGTDPRAALAAALAKRPLAVLTIEQSQWHDRYLPNDRLLAETLARDYVRVADLPNRDYGPPERLIVWRLR